MRKGLFFMIKLGRKSYLETSFRHCDGDHEFSLRVMQVWHAVRTRLLNGMAFHRAGPELCPRLLQPRPRLREERRQRTAIADFRKALEIDPSDQYAKNNLKRLGVTP